MIFETEFAGVRRRQFRRQLRRDAFHLALIRSDDRVDIRFRLGCFRFCFRHAQTVAGVDDPGC